MLRPRIIPCLLVRNKGLVKTVNFGESKYVGDPLNAVRIFNEKEVDEILVIDIDATAKDYEPDYKLIANLAAECRMPLCYGGGVKSSEQVERIVSLGVEKVALSSAVIKNPLLIAESAAKVGRQSIVVVLDVKKKGFFSKYQIFTHNARQPVNVSLSDFVSRLEGLGAGELVVNSIDHDGLMTGYDLELVRTVRELTNLPMSVLGGAGSLADISGLIREFGIVGAGAGSLFVFKGAYKAVLINYPNRVEKDDLLKSSLCH